MKAVRFDTYGGVEVLDVREVDDPVATPGRVVVAVNAAGINPGEIAIREGYLHDRWPATFPSGEGSDFAGIVQSVGDGVTAVSPGDDVLGWTEERGSHAELVATPSDHLTSKPPSVPWEVAGGLFVVGMAGYASGPGGCAAAGRDRCRVRRGRRRGLDRKSAGAPHRGDGDRAGLRAQP
jgi:NADPH:quinone reductase-like Zn-dependent oxidoreductase